MASVRVEGEIAADADSVWRLMSDFGGLRAWNPQIESCELEGQGVGAVRTFSMGGIVIKERLESLDDAEKAYSYSIVEGPIPAIGYLATVRLSEAGENRTRVLWTSEFEPQGASEADLVALFEGIYKGGIESAEKVLTRT